MKVNYIQVYFIFESACIFSFQIICHLVILFCQIPLGVFGSWDLTFKWNRIPSTHAFGYKNGKELKSHELPQNTSLL